MFAKKKIFVKSTGTDAQPVRIICKCYALQQINGDKPMMQDICYSWVNDCVTIFEESPEIEIMSV